MSGFPTDSDQPHCKDDYNQSLDAQTYILRQAARSGMTHIYLNLLSDRADTLASTYGFEVSEVNTATSGTERLYKIIWQG